MADMKRLTLQVIMQKLAAAAPDDHRIAALADVLEPLDDLWNVPSRFISQSNSSAARLSEDQTFTDHYQQVMRSVGPADLLLRGLAHRRRRGRRRYAQQPTFSRTSISDCRPDSGDSSCATWR